MAERKIVFDFHQTLVNKPHFYSRDYRWMPERIELMDELKLLGWSIAVWTADRARAIEDSNKILVPGLLGVARGGITDEYYARDKLPPLPDGYVPPYPSGSVYEYVHFLSKEDLNGPVIDPRGMIIGGTEYASEDEFDAEARRQLLLHDMRYGWKFPPVVGSPILVDDLVNAQGNGSMMLDMYARIFKFHLVDPTYRPQHRSRHAWRDYMLGALSDAKRSG